MYKRLIVINGCVCTQKKKEKRIKMSFVYVFINFIIKANLRNLDLERHAYIFGKNIG